MLGRFTGELVHESSMQYTSGPFDYTIDVELKVPEACPDLTTCKTVKGTLE